jgi:CheY-like chemotaxis protein
VGLQHRSITSALRSSQDSELRRVSVMIVDDDPEARDLLAAVIEKAGYTVVQASNGKEALELLHVVQPELIFLDVIMPIMDGRQFREEMRHDKQLLSIPTIVMTGIDDEPLLDLAVIATLRKPVRSRDLLALVAKHCGH